MSVKVEKQEKSKVTLEFTMAKDEMQNILRFQDLDLVKFQELLLKKCMVNLYYLKQ